VEPDIVARETIGTEGRDRRPLRVLGAFLAASLAAHAGVFVLMPIVEGERAPVRQGPLEVVVLKPEPMPVAPRKVEPESVPRPNARPPAAARPESRSISNDSMPVLALAMPETEPEGSFSVVPARLPDPPPARATLPRARESLAVTPPSLDAPYLNNPSAKYPEASIQAGEQGTVLLRVLVRRDGLPMRVELEKSSGSPHLDSAARNAVWGWRFVPARQGGNAIESWYGVPVVFRLEGAG